MRERPIKSPPDFALQTRPRQPSPAPRDASPPPWPNHLPGRDHIIRCRCRIRQRLLPRLAISLVQRSLQRHSQALQCAAMFARVHPGCLHPVGSFASSAVVSFRRPDSCPGVDDRFAEYHWRLSPDRKCSSKPRRQTPGSSAALASAALPLSPSGRTTAARKTRRSRETAGSTVRVLSSTDTTRAKRSAHASDIDAVLLGLKGEPAVVRSCWRELERRVRAAEEWTGAIVQRLVEPGGTDVLVGTVSDPDLGPVLALSLGGHQAGLRPGRSPC